MENNAKLPEPGHSLMIILALIFAIQVDWRDEIPDLDWTYVGASSDAVIFSQPGPRPNMHWQRQERRAADRMSVRSSMSLVEVDCAAGRSRYIQGTYYRESNLDGAPLHSDNTVEEWKYAGPGTLGAKFFRAVCG